MYCSNCSRIVACFQFHYHPTHIILYTFFYRSLLFILPITLSSPIILQQQLNNTYLSHKLFSPLSLSYVICTYLVLCILNLLSCPCLFVLSLIILSDLLISYESHVNSSVIFVSRSSLMFLQFNVNVIHSCTSHISTYINVHEIL